MMTILSDRQLVDIGTARAEDPEGTYCGKCGLTNDFADDIGWFYAGKPFVPHCSKCWNIGGYTTSER